jgi:hypothetical protein
MSDDAVIKFLRSRGQQLVELGTELMKQGVDGSRVVNVGLELANKAMELAPRPAAGPGRSPINPAELPGPAKLALGQRHRAVVVAVVPVRVVQVAVDQVVEMAPVRHRLVATAGAVAMRGVMAGAAVGRRAAVRVAP